MVTLLLALLAQNDGIVQRVEAMEILEQKPHFTYKFPQWATDEYLFSLAGYPLDDEIEKCIDATILTAELGGKPLSTSLVGPYEQLGRLKPDSAMRILEKQLDLAPAAEIRRQILLYRITGDWLRGDLKGARSSYKTLQADRDAAQGADLDYANSLLSYWEKGEISSTSDSLLYFLFVGRDPTRALAFVPEREPVSSLLRYHLQPQTAAPEGIGGRYLKIHRLLKQGLYSAAKDSLDVLSNERSPYSSLVRFDMAQTLLALNDARDAHLIVPDSFTYQWLLPQRSLALVRGQKEWMLSRPDDARNWFKRAAQGCVAFELYSQWIMSDRKEDALARSVFARRSAGDLYDLLLISGFLRNREFDKASPVLEGLVQRYNVSSVSILSRLIVGLYAAVEDERGNYQLVIGFSNTIKKLGSGTDAQAGTLGECYFTTAAHLAVANAYYYSGGRYQDMAIDFYKYCTKSGFVDLRHMGYFGLGWIYLARRDTVNVESVLKALEFDSLAERESQTLIYLRGLLHYAKRDFREAADEFARLNLSSIPEMRMQGLYFEARSWEQSGRPGPAASAFDELLSEFPAATEVRDSWTRLARAQVEIGMLDEAEKTLERLTKQGRLYHFEFGDLYREILLVIYDACMREGREDEAQDIALRLSRTQNSTLPLETYYYRLAEKDTALWQTDHLIGIINKLSEINSQSLYLPDLLLQVARQEIELADYEAAVKRLERIIQWPKLSDVSHLMMEASYELTRAALLSKNWRKAILQSEIFLNTYPNQEDASPRVLLFRAVALVEQGNNDEPLKRKEDAQQALIALDRLESDFGQTEYFLENTDKVNALRRSAQLLLQ